jgi:hypothetical protein
MIASCPIITNSMKPSMISNSPTLALPGPRAIVWAHISCEPAPPTPSVARPNGASNCHSLRIKAWASSHTAVIVIVIATLPWLLWTPLATGHARMASVTHG